MGDFSVKSRVKIACFAPQVCTDVGKKMEGNNPIAPCLAIL
jgi:hypothetical protein